MINDIYYSLQFSALIFFNILCILGIIIMVVVFVTVTSTASKINKTTEKIQETLGSATEVSQNVLEIISRYFKPKKTKGFWSIIAALMDK